jgi:ubiquitin-activating enzyme E1
VDQKVPFQHLIYNCYHTYQSILGKLFVTDADRIELSNLTRQFLFREHNVGHPKSKAASAMATVMNKDFNVEALELFVGPKTEDAFDDNFWIDLDGVCNALDNMEARLYVDAQCVKFEKPLLESGTMGTNGKLFKSYLHFS